MAVGVLVVAGFVTLAIWKYYTPPASKPEVVPKEKITTAPSEKPEAQPLTSSPKAVPPGEKETSPSLTKPSTPPTPAKTAMEVASVKKMAYPLPDKPSIAVLPFTNMSGEKEQEYFSD